MSRGGTGRYFPMRALRSRPTSRRTALVPIDGRLLGEVREQVRHRILVVVVYGGARDERYDRAGAPDEGCPFVRLDDHDGYPTRTTREDEPIDEMEHPAGVPRWAAAAVPTKAFDDDNPRIGALNVLLHAA